MNSIVEFRLHGWSFEDKTTKPLQAADVLAYELFKVGQNHIVSQSGRKLRASTKNLLRPQDLRYTHYWTVEDFKEWVALFKETYEESLAKRGR
jgi:hypothetical protein